MSALKDNSGKQSSTRYALFALLVFFIATSIYTLATVPRPPDEFQALPDIGEGWGLIFAALVAKIGSERFAKSGNSLEP